MIGAGVGYARAYFSDGEVGGTVTVVVKEGSSLRAIATELEQQGVVKHARAFEIRADADGYATRFMPGTYAFHVNEPYDGPGRQARSRASTRRRSRSPSPRARRSGRPRTSSPASSRRSRSGTTSAWRATTRRRSTLEGYKKGATLEGMLFPATYEVLPRKASAGSSWRRNSRRSTRTSPRWTWRRARAANLTEYDVVIIASMIDREALVPAERAVVAAVIWNRLRKDMLLQIDATIQYALGKTKPLLTYDDLEIDSPYNTYKHAGLPPTPISNPGLAALKAAANPTDDKYLYYVARNDGTGRHYFSTTYEQFLVDKAKAAANGE